MTALEAVAAALILANLALLVRRSLWNFPVGIAGVTLYGWIFYHSKIYSDALLQLFFVAVQLYGWRRWAAGKARFGEVLVLRIDRAERLCWLAAIAVLTAVWGWVIWRFTDGAVPWLDAAVAMTSVAAQILMTRQRIENWVLWIAVNAMSVALYATRGLYITMALYVLMLALSIWSLIEWRRAELRQRPSQTRAPPQ